jgi:hypothetical protein
LTLLTTNVITALVEKIKQNAVHVWLRRHCIMKLVPLFDRVVLKKMVEEETTASGIVLPGQGDKEKPGQGEIIAVGPGGLVDGKEVKMQVKAGDKVLYSRYAGSDVELDGVKYVVIKQSDILAVME